MGNRELLAIRLALGEWRHWLEGAAQPFIVWTDHRNLTHIRSAKRLNARQARWALFFGQFDFNSFLTDPAQRIPSLMRFLGSSILLRTASATETIPARWTCGRDCGLGNRMAG